MIGILAAWSWLACDPEPPPPSVRVDPVEAVEPAAPPGVQPGTIVAPSAGQRLYVPVYSSVTLGRPALEADVAVRLYVRNVSESETFRLVRVDLYDSEGRVVEHVLQEPMVVTPLQTRSFLVEASDLRSGTGGNYIVEWQADVPVTPPMVETVNGYALSNRAFAFAGDARVLAELHAGNQVGD